MSNRYIVIVGCGRLGSGLANQLSREGNSVVAIDLHQKGFSELSADFSGFKIVGNATEMNVLKEAKLDKADILIATTREDNINLMVAQVAAKIFQVPTVMARVFDPAREWVYAQMNIKTICPTTVATELFLSKIHEKKE